MNILDMLFNLQAQPLKLPPQLPLYSQTLQVKPLPAQPQITVPTQPLTMQTLQNLSNSGGLSTFTKAPPVFDPISPVSQMPYFRFTTPKQ